MSYSDDLERALTLLEAFVDDEPCTHDHHGSCQTHFSNEVDGRCSNVAALDFLDEQRPRWRG